MQTNFSLAQLADPDIAAVETILRSCVHCGFCTATCPTYVLLGDELDSPRGRIYLIKDTLENDKPAGTKLVKHIDRCLSCLSCMTTCPSGVNYMHLVDHARAHIERTFKRPAADRLMRALLTWVLPYPARFRLALVGALLARPLLAFLPRAGLFGRLRAMLAMAPAEIAPPSRVDLPQVFPAEGSRKARMALLSGCAQQVLAPTINEATIRLLTRHGVEVVVVRGSGCCGALVHHLGQEDQALAAARSNIAAWLRELDGDGLDAIVINASGCGTTVKDYGFMLRKDARWAESAARIAALTRDVTEVMAELGLKSAQRRPEITVAYHSACSMQHGQQIRREPKDLLAAAGFVVRDIPEGHLCCGSAGTYNLLQPALATRLLDRKIRNIEGLEPDVIATGNIGCMTQIGTATAVPIIHTAELLDWKSGGPVPPAMRHLDPHTGR